MLLVYDIVHDLGFYFVKYLIVFFSMQVFIRSVSKTAETIVNNLPIKEQRQLCDGDTIMIGQRAFIYYSDFANIKSKGPPSVSYIAFYLFSFLSNPTHIAHLQASKSEGPSRTPFKDAHGRQSETVEPRPAEALPKCAVQNDGSAVPARTPRFYGTPTKKLNLETTKTLDLTKGSDKKAANARGKQAPELESASKKIM
jgi:hypothetical protein